MKAPDKIYLQVCGTCPLEGVECERCNFDELDEVTWSTDKVFDKDVEYIRKDLLLEWAKKQFNLARKCMVEAERDWNRAYENGEMMAYDNIIKKLNSL